MPRLHGGGEMPPICPLELAVGPSQKGFRQNTAEPLLWVVSIRRYSAHSAIVTSTSTCRSPSMNHGMIWRANSLLVLLALSLLSAFQCAAEPQDKLSPDEYESVVLVVKAELKELGDKSAPPICVGVTPFRRAPEALLNLLVRRGLPISEQGACYPPKQYPRGTDISVQGIRRGPEGELNLIVESANVTLGPETHVGELIRRGTYRLKKNEKDEWTILNYTRGTRGSDLTQE
jgi:hypothetical protein